MPQVILYTRPDGGLSVVHPSPEWTGTLHELAQRVVPAGLYYRFMDSADLPSRDTEEDRHAWKDTGSAVVIDPARRAERVAQKSRSGPV